MYNLKSIMLIDDDYAELVLLKRAFEDLEIANPLVCLADCKEAMTYLREADNAKP